MTTKADNILKALQAILSEKQGEEAHITTTDPVEAAKRLNATMGELMPVIMVLSGDDRKALSAYMDGMVAIMLDDFKKAVVEEIIKSGAQDQLNEILGRGK